MSSLSVNTTFGSFQNPKVRNLERLQDLEQRFNAKLIGQETAVNEVCSVIRHIITGFHDESVPYGVLLFAGPTGVGKTELAKMVAEELAVPFLRYDMSEYNEKDCQSTLLGSGPGYRDSEKGGNLIKSLQEYPVAVVLFDEIEKAHPSIFPIFLQLFSEGRITDRMRNTVTAKNVIFIMTTNLGSREIFRDLQGSSAPSLSAVLRPLFVDIFSPELYGRIHKTIIFNNLKDDSLVKITENFMMTLMQEIYQRKNILVCWDHNVIEYLAHSKSSPEMGAREIQNRVRDLTLPILSKSYASQLFSEGDIITFYTQSDGLNIKVLSKGKKKSQRHFVHSTAHYDFYLSSPRSKL